MKLTKNIQYGCGTNCPDSWINFDASPTLLFEKIPIIGLFNKNKERFPDWVKYGNIVKGLPVAINSCDLVYCSHVLEHLSFNDCQLAIKNTYNLLKKNGVFRLVVPDFEYYVNEYLINDNEDASIEFFRNTLLGKEKRNYNLLSFIYEFFGNSSHLWMWDYKSMEKLLKNNGFTKIRRARYGDSEFEDFSQVEIEERWSNCLGLECIKM